MRVIISQGNEFEYWKSFLRRQLQLYNDCHVYCLSNQFKSKREECTHIYKSLFIFGRIIFFVYFEIYFLGSFYTSRLIIEKFHIVFHNENPEYKTQTSKVNVGIRKKLFLFNFIIKKKYISSRENCTIVRKPTRRHTADVKKRLEIVSFFRHYDHLFSASD